MGKSQKIVSVSSPEVQNRVRGLTKDQKLQILGDGLSKANLDFLVAIALTRDPQRVNTKLEKKQGLLDKILK